MQPSALGTKNCLASKSASEKQLKDKALEASTFSTSVNLPRSLWPYMLVAMPKCSAASCCKCLPAVAGVDDIVELLGLVEGSDLLEGQVRPPDIHANVWKGHQLRQNK